MIDMPRNTSESFSASYRDQIETHIETAATANARTERFAKHLLALIKLIDRKAMMSHADQCLLRDAEADLVEHGFAPDKRAEAERAYAEWESRR